MIRVFCDLCDKELNEDNHYVTAKTQWYEVRNTCNDTQLDICNECMQKIVNATEHI